AIAAYTLQGYTLAARTAVSASLIKRKEFSVAWAVIGALICVIPLLVYVLVWSSQSDQYVESRLRGAQPVYPGVAYAQSYQQQVAAEIARLWALAQQGVLTPTEFEMRRAGLLQQAQAAPQPYPQVYPPPRSEE